MNDLVSSLKAIESFPFEASGYFIGETGSGRKNPETASKSEAD
jgi:hypothetical protein